MPWSRSFNARRSASSNKRGWPAPTEVPMRPRNSAEPQKRWAGTIFVPAAQARNTRSATEWTRRLFAKALRDLLKREVVRFGSRLIAPAFKNATVTERNELALADAELLRRCIDPVTRAFQFGIEP